MDPLTTMSRPTHGWKVVVQTPEQKLYAPSDKAVENSGTRWKEISSKVKSREAEPKWERKKKKLVNIWRGKGEEEKGDRKKKISDRSKEGLKWKNKGWETEGKPRKSKRKSRRKWAATDLHHVNTTV